jgi:hypothetical protein
LCKGKIYDINDIQKEKRMEGHKNDLQGIKFIIESGPYAGKSYFAFPKILCDNPACPCADVVLFTGEIDNQSRFIAQPFTLRVDVKKRKKSQFQDQDNNPDNKLRDTLLAEITNEGWEYLYQSFIKCKRDMENRNSIKPGIFDFSACEAAIENESYMLGYTEIFPYSESFRFPFNGFEYIVDDMYCLNSDCHCTHAALTFIAVFESHEGAQNSPTGMKITNTKKIIDGEKAPSINYDYKTKKWNVERAGVIEKGSMEELVSLFLRNYPQMDTLLKKRHKTLRDIYAEYRGAHFPSRPITTIKEKIGRNAPCPCNSGKKYKNCCGR